VLRLKGLLTIKASVAPIAANDALHQALLWRQDSNMLAAIIAKSAVPVAPAVIAAAANDGKVVGRAIRGLGTQRIQDLAPDIALVARLLAAGQFPDCAPQCG
jgi:hypothetical protein